MLPREIQAEHWPERSTYNLPIRPIGKLRYFGFLPIGFAVLFESVPVKLLLGPLQHVLRGNAGLHELILFVFISIFLIGALVPFGIGLFILAGRTRLVVTRDRIIVTEIAGPFRRSRKVGIRDIQRFEFGAGQVLRQQNAAATSIAALGALVAILADGKTRLLLLGYPREWIEALAEELTSVPGLQGQHLPIREVQRLPPDPLANLDAPAGRPQGTRVTVEPGPNGPCIEIPPPGLRKGSKGLFGIGTVWCLFMGIFGWLATFAAKGRAHPIPRPLLLFLAAFWLIGLGLVSVALNMARRRATLSVESTALRLEQRSLFGSKKRYWHRDEIAAVRVGESGIKINNVPVLELQIHLLNGKKNGFLAGRAEEELRWIASELRDALKLPAATRNMDAPSLAPAEPGLS